VKKKKRGREKKWKDYTGGGGSGGDWLEDAYSAWREKKQKGEKKGRLSDTRTKTQGAESRGIHMYGLKTP